MMQNTERSGRFQRQGFQVLSSPEALAPPADDSFPSDLHSPAWTWVKVKAPVSKGMRAESARLDILGVYKA